MGHHYQFLLDDSRERMDRANNSDKTDNGKVTSWISVWLQSFLLLGGSLFILFRVVSGPSATSDTEITVTDAAIIRDTE